MAAEKEFQVMRKTVTIQGFRVMARTAREARTIIENLPTSYATDPDDTDDKRITWISQPDVERDPTYFVRTMSWVPA